MPSARFERTDSPFWWGALLAAMFALQAYDHLSDGETTWAAVGGVSAALQLFVFGAWRQRVTVDDAAVRVRRGWGSSRLTVPLSDVRRVRVRPWGEGARIGEWSAHGADVVELTRADGSSVQVGTKHAGELAAALEAAGAERDPDDRLPPDRPWMEDQHRRAMWFSVAFLTVALLVGSWTIWGLP
jgi:hypothetical protein